MLRLALIGMLLLAVQPASAQSDEQADALEQPYYVFPRSAEQHLDLSSDWELNYTDVPVGQPGELEQEESWISVADPTSVQMALYENGYAEHPYENLNSEQYAWVDEKVWYYRKTFDVPADMREAFMLLSFDGLDYYSRVWLNGKLLGQHEGMFGGPVVEVSDLLDDEGANELIVELRAANYGQKDAFRIRTASASAVKPWYLAGGPGIRMFFPLGMWKGVRLEAIPRVHMSRPFFHTERLAGDTALVSLSVELLGGLESTDLELHAWDNRQLANYSNVESRPTYEPIEGNYTLRVEMALEEAPAFIWERPVTPVEGRIWIEDTLQVPDAKLWWPNGLGEQHLYEVRASLLRDGEVVDETPFDFGIRTLENRRSAGPRTHDRWTNWQFAVNGRSFFAKGINWMPADMLYDLSKEKYRWLLETARDAGIQMIRVWGGGLIETEAFYEAANRAGILVFQDFPLGNRDHPNLNPRVWEAQVIHNILRLRNEPSLAVWNGGNEFNPYSLGNTAITGILERSIAEFDPTRLFLRTSPDEGGIHLYPDMDPTWYKKLFALTPFVEETGIHSMADAQNIREVVDDSELERLGKNMFDEDFASTHPDFIHHFAEYSPGRVPRMLSRASHVQDITTLPLEEIVEATQVGAGEFYQHMSEGFQANYPVTTGLLPWVFKRPWPVVAAIHLLDGHGQPDAPYYFLKRTYEPTHVQLDLPRLFYAPGEEVPLQAQVVHAPEEQLRGATVTVRILDDRFETLHENRTDVNAAAGPSVAVQDIGAFTIPEDYRDRYFFAVVELEDADGRQLSRSEYWPRSLSKMEDQAFRAPYLKAPQEWPLFEEGPWLKPAVECTRTALTAEILNARPTAEDETAMTVQLRNTGDSPAFMAHLNVADTPRLFRADDNFFWLAPGEERAMQVTIRWRDLNQRSNARLVLDAWNADSVSIPLATYVSERATTP